MLFVLLLFIIFLFVYLFIYWGFFLNNQLDGKLDFDRLDYKKQFINIRKLFWRKVFSK